MLAQQALKDPYVFDFLTLHDDHLERDLERAMLHNIEKVLLEMGKSFSFVGRQYHLEVGDRDFYIDLLFYHIKLKCYVVVELKTQDFDPSFAGQLAFYTSSVDLILREKDENPTKDCGLTTMGGF